MKCGWVSILLWVVLAVTACVDDFVDRGNGALRIGDYRRAVQNFNQALDQEPAHRDARYGLALAYYGIAEESEKIKEPTFEQWENVVKEFEILSKIDSGTSFNGIYSNSLFYLARASISRNEKANVLPLLDRSILLDSLNYFSLNLKGLILANLGRTEEARKNFVYILTKDPKFASAYVNLGNLYWNEGDVESAWDIWSMGLEALPRDPVLAHWTKVAQDSLAALVMAGKL